jgi:hypothetical protein
MMSQRGIAVPRALESSMYVADNIEYKKGGRVEDGEADEHASGDEA